MCATVHSTYRIVTFPSSNVLVLYFNYTECVSMHAKSYPSKDYLLHSKEALFQNVFRHFGLPEDIDSVSDRGPQFISRVWQAFFKLLGVSVSLTSGYHPQTNSQTE